MGSAAARLRRRAPGVAAHAARGAARCRARRLHGGGGPGSLTPPPAPDGPPVKVAILVPLSSQGHPGLIAKSLKQAAELALFERDNPNLQLMVKDDLGTPEGAKAAAEDVLKRGATLILGPLYAKSVAAVAPVARKAGVPVVAFSNDRQVAGHGVYLLSFQPAPEVERIVAYAAKRGKKRLRGADPAGQLRQGGGAGVPRRGGRAGGSVVALRDLPGLGQRPAGPAAQDRRGHRRRRGWRRRPIDALFLPGGQEYLENIARLLPHAKIDVGKVKLLGTGGMDYPNAGRDKSLIGAWYPGPDPRGWSDFAQKYAKTYGQGPPRIAGGRLRRGEPRHRARRRGAATRRPRSRAAAASRGSTAPTGCSPTAPPSGRSPSWRCRSSAPPSSRPRRAPRAPAAAALRQQLQHLQGLPVGGQTPRVSGLTPTRVARRSPSPRARGLRRRRLPSRSRRSCPC